MFVFTWCFFSYFSIIHTDSNDKLSEKTLNQIESDNQSNKIINEDDFGIEKKIFFFPFSLAFFCFYSIYSGFFLLTISFFFSKDELELWNQTQEMEQLMMNFKEEPPCP